MELIHRKPMYNEPYDGLGSEVMVPRRGLEPPRAKAH
jgi:hypothetical protein